MKIGESHRFDAISGAAVAVGVGHLGGGQGDLHLHNQAGRQGQVLLPGILSGD